MVRAASILALLLLIFATFAVAEVRITVDLDCRTTFDAYQPVSGKIVAFDTEFRGIRSLEFAVPGFPMERALVTSDANPDASEAIGNPFGAGARITFAECQGATGGTVLLYHFVVLPMVDFELPTIELAPSRQPDASTGPCPQAALCDGASECAVAIDDGSFVAPVGTPTPAHGSRNVDLNIQLRWVEESDPCSCLGLPCAAVHFGTDPDPPLIAQGCSGTNNMPGLPFDPGELQPSTTYYWRVNYSWCASVPSPMWSFTTAERTPVAPTNWTRIKLLFR